MTLSVYPDQMTQRKLFSSNEEWAMKTQFMARANVAFLVAIATLATGCASLKSFPLKDGVTAKAGESGITYYLPMRFAEVTFERKQIKQVDPAELKSADAAAITAKKALSDADAELAAASQRVVKMRQGGVESTVEVMQQLMLAEINAGIVRAAAKQNLDDAVEKLEALKAKEQEWVSAGGGCAYVDHFTVKLLAPVADTRQRFSLKMRHLWTRSDDWHITTTQAGLLSTANGAIKDESAEIIIALARSAVPFQKPRTEIPTIINKAGDDENKCKIQELSMKEIFDPADSRAWKNFLDKVNTKANKSYAATFSNIQPCHEKNYLMPECGVLVKKAKENQGQTDEMILLQDGVDVTLPKGTLISRDDGGQQELDEDSQAKIRVEKTQSTEPSLSPKAGSPGVYYRREVPLVVQIDENRTSAGAFLLMLPNHSPTELMPARAGGFVTTTQKLGFDNGILVSVDSTRPSEILRVASIPWDIANATLGAVSQLVKLRVDVATSDADLVTQQTRLLQQLQAELEARQALDAARRANDDTSLP